MTNEQILEDAEKAGFKVSKVSGVAVYVEIMPIGNCCKVELTKFAELTKARSQWIDCSVELPDEGVNVLGFFEHDEIMVCNHINGDWADGLEFNILDQPTYWHAIPLPPNAQQERN